MLQAIPTICLLIIVHFYLKFMLFKPLDKVMEQRAELTEGARKAAEHSLSEADRKQREYEAKFREARGEVYRAQEETRRGWLNDQNTQIAAARERSELSVRTAKEQIAAETTIARDGLAQTSSALADEIANSVLSRRSA